MGMHLVGHLGHDWNIAVVPQAALDAGAVLGSVMDFHLFGAHNRPATFGLHTAHLRHAGGVGAAHAIAVRHLVEPVACRNRTDLDRLEQDVVARIAVHSAAS